MGKTAPPESSADREKRRRQRRQKEAEEAYGKMITEHVDVEQLLLTKIDQRTKGGTSNLLKAFRKFDTSSDKAEITFEQFRVCLNRFGLSGLPPDKERALFDRYDLDGSGTIDFREFTVAVTGAYANRSNIGETATDIQEAKRAREEARLREIQAERNKMQILKVNVEDVLLEKIEQRISGGPHSLRLAFKKFDSGGKGGDTTIDFDEFQNTLEAFGLSGLGKEDVRQLFNRYDADGSGAIDFSEFVSGVMKSRSSQSMIAMKSTAAADAERRKNAANDRARRFTDMHWRYAIKHMDLEAMLLQKIEQRTSGGPHELRRAFGVFDSDTTDGAMQITIEMFKEGLDTIGLRGLPIAHVRKLFNKYDTSGDGIIDFDEFVKGVMKSTVPLRKSRRREPSGRGGSARTERRHRRRHHRRRPESTAGERSDRELGDAKSAGHLTVAGISARLPASSEMTQGVRGVPRAAAVGVGRQRSADIQPTQIPSARFPARKAVGATRTQPVVTPIKSGRLRRGSERNNGAVTQKLPQVKRRGVGVGISKSTSALPVARAGEGSSFNRYKMV